MCCRTPNKQKARITRIIITTVLGILSTGMVACSKGNAAVPNIVTEVLIAQPVQHDVPLQREWVASLDGYVNADIRPQVSGYIISQNYKEGSAVSKGQVLFEIDPRPFQAALDSAKAHLAQAQAELGRTTLDVERDTPLASRKPLPRRNSIRRSRPSSLHRRRSNRRRRLSSAQNSISVGPRLLRWSMEWRVSPRYR